MDHSDTYKCYINVFNFNIAHHLREYVPPLTLYLNVEDAQHPAWKHFYKTNMNYFVRSLQECAFY